MTFANRLRELRESRGYNQRQLAAVMNLAHGTIANYENGRREPDFTIAQRFAEFFNCTLDYLVGRVDNPSEHAPLGLPAGAESKMEEYLLTRGLAPDERKLVLDLIKKLERK